MIGHEEIFVQGCAERDGVMQSKGFDPDMMSIEEAGCEPRGVLPLGHDRDFSGPGIGVHQYSDAVVHVLERVDRLVFDQNAFRVHAIINQPIPHNVGRRPGLDPLGIESPARHQDHIIRPGVPEL